MFLFGKDLREEQDKKTSKTQCAFEMVFRNGALGRRADEIALTIGLDKEKKSA